MLFLLESRYLVSPILSIALCKMCLYGVRKLDHPHEGFVVNTGSSRESVHGLGERQAGHAVVEVADIVLCGAESVGLVTNHLCLVVEPFYGAVVDGHGEVVQQALLVAAKHPREVSHGLEARMGCPPEPLAEIPSSPVGIGVVPELAKGLFEQVSTVDLQV